MIEPLQSQHRAATARVPKILVVDDEIDVLRSTQMLLDRLGYQTLLLPEVQHVVEVIEAERPDLVLQDLVMPHLDLDALFRNLRASSRPDVPVVLFSATDDLPERAAAMDAAGFLHKPFAEQQLREILQSILGPLPKRTDASNAPANPAFKPELDAYFHEYRNTLTALNNYAQFLLSSARVQDPEREAVEEINRLLLDLERRAEALRSRLF